VKPSLRRGAFAAAARAAAARAAPAAPTTIAIGTTDTATATPPAGDASRKDSSSTP